MRLFPKIGLIIAAAAIGTFVGISMREKGNPDRVATSELESRRLAMLHSNRSEVESTISGTQLDASPLAVRLSQDLSMSQGVTRWLHWMEALETAAPSDFPRLVRLAEKSPHALRLLAAKWIEMDPRHLFDHLLSVWGSGGSPSASTLANVLFEEWPKRDLAGVLNAMSGTNTASMPRNWRMQVASRVFDVDVERGIKLFADWDIQNHSPRMTSVRKWAAENPRHAAEFALANPAGYASVTIMETIGKEWAKLNPAAALQFSAGRAGEMAQRLTDSALKEWGSKDLNAAAEWLGTVDPHTRARLSVPFVEVWAKTDPMAALTWCEANLAGSMLGKAIGGVFNGAAAKDVTFAADLVSTMQPSVARSEAAVAVAKKWFPDSFGNKPVPPQTIQWLSGLDKDSIKRVLDDRTWNWVQIDAKQFAGFLSLVGNDGAPSHAYSTLASRLARDNPLEALSWTATLPENVGISAAMNAFGQWRDYNPAAAGEWLTALPATDPRRESLLQSYVQSLANDLHGEEHLANLKPADRKTTQQWIEKAPIPQPRRAALLQALK